MGVPDSEAEAPIPPGPWTPTRQTASAGDDRRFLHAAWTAAAGWGTFVASVAASALTRNPIFFALLVPAAGFLLASVVLATIAYRRAGGRRASRTYPGLVMVSSGGGFLWVVGFGVFFVLDEVVRVI